MILPIIQARDMPDLDEDYVDGMTGEEFAVIVFTLEKTVAEGCLKKSSKSMISAKV